MRGAAQVALVLRRWPWCRSVDAMLAAAPPSDNQAQALLDGLKTGKSSCFARKDFGGVSTARTLSSSLLTHLPPSRPLPSPKQSGSAGAAEKEVSPDPEMAQVQNALVRAGRRDGSGWPACAPPLSRRPRLSVATSLLRSTSDTPVALPTLLQVGLRSNDVTRVVKSLTFLHGKLKDASPAHQSIRRLRIQRCAASDVTRWPAGSACWVGASSTALPV